MWTRGLTRRRFRVKPNFLNQDPGQGTGEGNYAVFVGRLSPEKGLDSLLEAWRNITNGHQTQDHR